VIARTTAAARVKADLPPTAARSQTLAPTSVLQSSLGNIAMASLLIHERLPSQALQRACCESCASGGHCEGERMSAIGGLDSGPTGSTPETTEPTTPNTPVTPATPTSPSTPQSSASLPTPSSHAELSWTQVLAFANDALWWFCGENPRWFSSTALLRAAGYTDQAALTWRITQGADKVAFQGPPTGPEVRLRSTAGSARADDVTVAVAEGTRAGAPSFSGSLTVRKPHRQILEAHTPIDGCPPRDVVANCVPPVHWDRFIYRILDNMGGTIIGAAHNESFPGPVKKDEDNDWPLPGEPGMATGGVARTGGTVADDWVVSGNLSPLPVEIGDPRSRESVDHIPQQQFVGSDQSGKGCRVETHVMHRFLGETDVEDRRTPAP
jgi:hypothetical protein